MAMNHLDRCTHIELGAQDVDILTRKNFDVNIRLFKVNEEYRELVLSCCRYIQKQAMTHADGYKKPHGFSGANAGIPFRIIALADGTVMINPRYQPVEIGGKRSMSNCGSLTLKEPIEIWRHKKVSVEYIDENGDLQAMIGYLPTVQHEVDHCNGILIAERKT